MNAEALVDAAVLDKIHGAGAQRIVRATGHAVYPLFIVFVDGEHFWGWCPFGPFGLSLNGCTTSPKCAFAAHTYSVTNGAVVALREVEVFVLSIDDDRACAFVSFIVDFAFAIFVFHLICIGCKNCEWFFSTRRC